MSGHTAARAVRRPRSVTTSALVVLWLVVPLVPLVVWAGTSRWSGTSRLPQDLGLRGWDEALDGGLLPALVRSAALGVAVALVATPLGVMAGRALGWHLLRRPALPSVVLLAPVVLAPFAVAMGLDVVVLRLGVPGEVAVVLVLSVFALPYTTFTMRATYLGVDPALEEQARVLGANARQARLRVTLPAASTGVVTATGLAFLVGWSDYTVTLLIGGGQLITAPMLIGSSAAGSGNDPQTAALALAATIPPVLALAVFAFAGARRRSAARS
ncbi:ABC transporter permease [Sanguibacter antarcticus]|uniref:Putative spermidine/putrescine transport system permease protein n=1 Tax=Sanguibacter antarcticus TaxID=372484 RepID=A0A2A9E2J5_9MICO|nr:ABC transporter permease subunit [Sanguibacter antarcticus]PFG32876.1 putative spermidine/putrescine transport system permease protein [Sanguibacter antarcticus]